MKHLKTATFCFLSILQQDFLIYDRGAIKHGLKGIRQLIALVKSNKLYWYFQLYLDQLLNLSYIKTAFYSGKHINMNILWIH